MLHACIKMEYLLLIHFSICSVNISLDCIEVKGQGHLLQMNIKALVYTQDSGRREFGVIEQ